MIEVGVRKLKNELSRYLRRVQAGERVRITMRGRPVADIVPPVADLAETDLDRMIAVGRVTPGRGRKPGEPPEPVDLGYSASERILAEREEDR